MAISQNKILSWRIPKSEQIPKFAITSNNSQNPPEKLSFVYKGCQDEYKKHLEIKSNLPRVNVKHLIDNDYWPLSESPITKEWLEFERYGAIHKFIG